MKSLSIFEPEIEKRYAYKKNVYIYNLTKIRKSDLAYKSETIFKEEGGGNRVMGGKKDKQCKQRC